MVSLEVSYVIVCFNSEKYVEKCISSIVNQTHTDSEIIVVDNNSKDGTLSILKKLSSNDKKVKVISHQTNVGYGEALNEAIRNATGKFIALLNADVYLDENWTHNLLKTFKKDEKIMACSGKIFFPNGELLSSGGIMDIYGAVIQRGSKISNLLSIPDDSFFYLDGSSFMVRKNILEEISFDPKLFLYYEDVDFSWKLRLLGYKIEYVEEAISYHDVGHSNSGMSTSKFYNMAKNRIYVCQKNYSKRNIITRMPIMLLLIFINAVFYDISQKPKGYVKKYLEAFFWNLFNLSSTLKEQKKIQSTRKIMDNEIDWHILKKSIEFAYLNKFL